MSNEHLKPQRQPDELPEAIQKIREDLSRVKKGDFKTYCGLADTYKAAMMEFAGRRKANLRFALNMAADDVCGIPRFRLSLAAAGQELALDLGLREYKHHPKMVFKALSAVHSGSNKATHNFAEKAGKRRLQKQIKKVAKAAKHEMKLAAKREKKRASKTTAQLIPAA